jgi:hypothetical protein
MIVKMYGLLDLTPHHVQPPFALKIGSLGLWSKLHAFSKKGRFHGKLKEFHDIRATKFPWVEHVTTLALDSRLR